MMRSMTRAVSAAVLSSLLATSAMAAPLPAGKPAGAKDAAMLGPSVIWIGLAGIIAVTVGVVASNSGGDGVTTPSTSATGTAGLP